MKGTTRAVVAIALAACSIALAEDWPRWLGPRGDGISLEKGLAERWPADGPKRLWSRKVGIGYASPVAVAGKLYLFYMEGADEVLRALDAADGKELWAQRLKTGYRNGYAGTRATPTIEGERIYTYGGNGDLVCRALADGKLLWHLNVLKATGGRNISWGMSSAPLIVGERVVVQGGSRGPAAVAVNKADGKVAWRSQAANGSYAAVVAVEVEGRPQLVVFGSNAVTGVDPADGKSLWAKPWSTSYDVHATTPIHRDGHLFITSGYNTGSMMLKLSRGGAEVLWKKKDPHDRFQPAVLDGDCLFVNSEGTLLCVSWPDGAVKWSDKSARLGVGGSLVRVGKALITMGEGGQLSLLKATPAGCQLVSKANVFGGGQIWATPLIYNGRLYCKGGDELVCLDIAAATR